MINSVTTAPLPITRFTGQRARWHWLAVGARVLAIAASIAAAAAASITVVATGSINGNTKTITEATGNSMNATTFASSVETAFANDTGGVWNFDGPNFGVNVGETITLNYGASQTNSEVLTLSSGNNINQGNVAGEATSGSTELGLGGDASTRTFTLSTPLSSVGIFSLNRADSSRTSVLSVTFLDDSTASTSGANAGATYFQELSATGTNYIKSFSLTQSNFVRYDDLGFVAAVPEPSTAAFVTGGVGMLALLRRRRTVIRG